MGGGGKGGGSQTVTQRQDPWKGEVPFLTGGYFDPKTGLPTAMPKSGAIPEGAEQIKGALNEAGRLYSSGGLQKDFYPGQTIADQSGTTGLAQDLTTQRALGGSGVVNAAKDYSQAALGGGLLNSNPGSSMYAATYGQSNPAMGMYADAVAGAGNNRALGMLQRNYFTAQNNPAAMKLNATASGAYLNSNPYLDATFNKAADSVQSRVNSAFAGGGRFGGGLNQRVMADSMNDLATNIYGGAYETERGRQEAATGLLGSQYLQSEGLSQNAANSIGSLLNQGKQLGLSAISGLGSTFSDQQRLNQNAAQGVSGNYNLERGLQDSAAARAPQLGATDYADLQALAGVGQAKDQRAQDLLNADIQRFDFNQQAPIDAIAQYRALTGQTGGGSSSSTTPLYSNPGAGILGGAIGGAQLGGMLGGGYTALPWLGTGANLAGFMGSGAGIGGLLGAGLGIMSDRRLKENIEHVGEENGFPIYHFNYIGMPQRYKGVMAQDVIKIKPEAVIEEDGVYRVNYGALGIEMEPVTSN